MLQYDCIKYYIINSTSSNLMLNKMSPMILSYAGPGTQAVTSKFILQRSTDNWLVHMASEHRVLVVTIDGRGTMANGDDLKFAIFKKMANVEIEDQMLGAE